MLFLVRPLHKGVLVLEKINGLGAAATLLGSPDLVRSCGLECRYRR